MDKKQTRPMDVVTSYNSLIMATYNNFNNKINSDDISFYELVNYIVLLTGLYKLENEKLGLSFYDKDGNRYINYLNSYPMILKYMDDGHIIQEAYQLLVTLKAHFFGECKDEFNDNPMNYIAPREGAIINLLFTNKKSREILERNRLSYEEGIIYKSNEDKIYCEEVLELIKEIAIRSANYSKYICGNDYNDSTDEDVYRMYEKLYFNYLDGVEYVNKNAFQKYIFRLNYYKRIGERYKKK